MLYRRRLGVCRVVVGGGLGRRLLICRRGLLGRVLVHRLGLLRGRLVRGLGLLPGGVGLIFHRRDLVGDLQGLFICRLGGLQGLIMGHGGILFRLHLGLVGGFGRLFQIPVGLSDSPSLSPATSLIGLLDCLLMGRRGLIQRRLMLGSGLVHRILI